MARPKLTDEQRRSVNFTVRLSRAEMKRLDDLAVTCGKAAGILAREKIFSGRFPEPRFARLDRDTYVELKKIGVNLNQLVKKVNAGVVPNGLLAGIIRLQLQQEQIIKLLLHDSKSKDR